MTHNVSSDDQHEETSWDEAVRRYLEQHPDFFERHPALLAKLELSHGVDGRAVSLIERQVAVLRQENAALAKQLRELVGIARENDAVAARLHRFALAMADSSALDDVFDTAYEMLRREFRLDAIAIRCRGRAPGNFSRAEFVGDDARLPELLKRFDGQRPLCGNRADESLLGYLFGRQASEVRSSAIIPLGNRDAAGVLALGSHDPQRFHADMGTIHLVKLGDILAHSIARFS